MIINMLAPKNVPGAGLEPARPQWPLDFKSNVSTSSTTRATFQKNISLVQEISDFLGAKDGIRTRDPDLGKVVLYQLSYFRLSNLRVQIYIFLIEIVKFIVILFLMYQSLLVEWWF